MRVERAVSACDLLERTRDGDVASFARFYDEEATGLLRWFRRRTAATDVAADLCAETFAKTLQTLPRYDSRKGSGPRGWLYGIARNELRHWLRRQAVQNRAREKLGIVVGLPAADDLDLVELRLEIAEVAGSLAAAMAALSPAIREAVVLRVVNELTYSEVASRLGCTEGAARVRVSRGLSTLFDRLNREES